MPVPEQRATVDRQLLRDTAYTKVCAAIVDGTLAPGEHLHDEELCGWLGLSRTPVRDALSRLRDEGLVEMAPQRFTRVAMIAGSDVRNLATLLAVVHALATELAVPRVDAAALRALSDHNDAFVAALIEHDAAAAYAADFRLHGVLVDASGNCDLARVVDQLSPKLRRLEHAAAPSLPGRRSIAQHQALIARAERGDAAGAASAARANWLTLGGVLERGLTPNAASGRAGA